VTEGGGRPLLEQFGFQPPPTAEGMKAGHK